MSSKTGSDLFIVDNSDEEWKVRNYLSEWTEISSRFDIATGLSEGLNLQDATRFINYDLHWNPVRLMQRIGRVDRRLNPAVGQRLPVGRRRAAGLRLLSVGAATLLRARRGAFSHRHVAAVRRGDRHGPRRAEAARQTPRAWCGLHKGKPARSGDASGFGRGFQI